MGVFNQTPLVGPNDIRSLARVLTLDHRMRTADRPLDQPPLLGDMYQHEVQPGLFLRINRIRDRVGLHSEAVVSPGLKVAVVWKGEARISFGSQPLVLGRNHRFPAMVAALDQPITFQRHGIKGGIEHSVILTATPAWLQRRFDHGSATRLLNRTAGTELSSQSSFPFQIEQWQPSPDLAHKLETLDISSTASPVRLLKLEAIALDLIRESLIALDSPIAHSESSRHDWQYLLECLINSGEAGRLSQPQLAQRLGMSLRQLQRRYRQQFQVPLGEHLRRRKLQCAYDALSHDSTSVENAAAIAGYSSATNFATAFKKVYGITPSTCRRAKGKL
ncbi:helix-turn-helix transcriptional regulator [Halomonas huangheensis]|uniref:HTH araC/xylS-type domain-containing protein n=1 Tax=Halomonas huangheensis TaxID=1178482 RepID=W1N245_9GAMM|nr:AraC family transcriptional regulator [Halomonas huangheensis]ALM51123.1 hypothetical protein AR456_01580 [Halomonas huangheensis]ERL49559.1 hypothetical protein BJB45_00020 [Halomonas huangheensis]